MPEFSATNFTRLRTWTIHEAAEMTMQHVTKLSNWMEESICNENISSTRLIELDLIAIRLLLCLFRLLFRV